MIQSILLTTDNSAPAKRAADFAALLATRCDAKIVVLYAYDPVPRRLGEPYYSQTVSAVLQEARSLVDNVAEYLRTLGVAQVDTDILEGPASEAILRVAETRKPDLLVIGARGMSTWQGLLLGSVSMAVTQRAECPVLVVK